MNATYNQSNNSRQHYDIEIVLFSKRIEFWKRWKSSNVNNKQKTNKQTKQANQNRNKTKQKNIKETKTKTLESPYFLVSLN